MKKFYRPFCIDDGGELHHLLCNIDIHIETQLQSHLSRIYTGYSSGVFSYPFRLGWLNYYSAPIDNTELLEYYSFREFEYAYVIFDACANCIKNRNNPGSLKEPYKSWANDHIQKFYDLAIKWPFHIAAYETYDDRSKVLIESWTDSKMFEINKEIYDKLYTDSFIKVGEYVDDIIDIFIEKIKDVLRKKGKRK